MFVNPDCCCKNFLSHIRVKIPLIHAYESQNYDDGKLQLVQSHDQCWGRNCLFASLTYLGFKCEETKNWLSPPPQCSFHSHLLVVAAVQG